MLRAKTSRRGTHHRPEVALAPGPIAEAVAGDGSFAALYSHAWSLLLESGGDLRLYQQEGSAWVERMIVPIPHDGREIRHVSLAWDQAARYVIAYEHNQQVWVRQWDPELLTYVMRGPWPGVDPVLIQDVLANRWLPDSDVHLYHLDTSRSALIFRVQREHYATPRTIHSYSQPAILDQATALPLRVQLLTATVANENELGVVVRTGLYPYRAISATLQLAGQFSGGTYLQIVQQYNQQQRLSLSGQFSGGTYLQIVQRYNQQQRLSLGGQFSGGVYALIAVQYQPEAARLQLSGQFSGGVYAAA